MAEEFPEVAELVPEGKKRNKGIWETKFFEFVQSPPDDLEVALQTTEFKSGTKTLILDYLLPRLVFIPAIKEVDSATKRSGEFGDLIDQLSAEIQDELDDQLQDKLTGFNPRGHDSIVRVERKISEHLHRTFENQSVKLDFPEFSTEYLFRNADIRIQEEHIETLSKENVGEGVKRTLIFSLLRTLADIWENRITITEDGDTADKPRPLLLLYEEAELFLHPTLQKTLLSTLNELTASNAQILFSTHSPVLIQHETLDTINIVRKDREDGTTVTQFHSVLDRQDPADQSRLTDLKSVSSYIFSEKVVLVEGISDKIVFEKISPHFDPKWDFSSRGIPVLDAGGKGDVCRFKRFLEDLGIETFALFDVDAAKNECETVVSTGDALEKLDAFNEAVESEFSGPRYSPDDLETAMRTLPWDDAFENLDDLKNRLEDGGSTTQEDVDLLVKVLEKCEETTPPKEVWTSRSVEDERIEVVEELLDENILLLSGDLEDYYPVEEGGKREAALQFDPTDYEREDLCEEFQPLETYDRTDVEEFLYRIFESEGTRTVRHEPMKQ